MSTESVDDTQSIAVIGLSGRFPMARDVEELWRNVAEGRECVSRFTDEELAAEGVPEAIRRSPDHVPARAILEDAHLFDAAFFGFTPGEAKLTDPQHRLFLECAWEALEQAGYDPSRYPDYIGVYGGADVNAHAVANLAIAGSELWGLIGNDKDYFATRVSYKLNLRGPGMTIQSACSTSLVAVQVACQALLGYQCDMALAGGAGIAVPQKTGYLYHKGGILSPDGHCRTFDAEARGTVGGNGVGVVLLKRLGDAHRDRDTIHAVIRGAAINNDGSGKVGYTAPSVEGQAEVIAMALAMAGISPETIGLVEAHGTATELGDPVEIAALTDAYRSHTDKRGYCAIGSLKSNLGHMNSAAGVGGLIKAIMALRHAQIPPSLHFQKPNPNIDFAASPFYVSTKLAPWPKGAHPRRAAVSSFGVGGTNAHAILEEAPPPEPGGPSRAAQLLVLSARTETALAAASQNLAAHLEKHPDLDLADVAYTLAVGRQLFKHRRLVVCRDAARAREALGSPAPTMTREKRRAPVVFMFPGQGSQHPDMGRELYEGEVVFRDAVDACARILTPHLGLDLRGVLFGGEAEAERLTRTDLAQPALFTIEYALAQLWMSWGVKPEAMIGHSIGEYVAACLAGVMSLDDALALVAARGRLMGRLPAGAMLSAPISEDEAVRLHGVSVAAINAPRSTVISGPADAIQAAAAELRARGIEGTLLHTSHAFHSAMMDPILPEFRAVAARVRLSPPAIPVLSNLTGTWLTPADATDPGYWVSHLRRPVRFAAGLSEILGDPDRLLLEVGPGRALSSLAVRQSNRSEERVFASLAHPRSGTSALESVLEALGRLYLSDVAVDFPAFYAAERRHRVPLPTYPFERRRFVREIHPMALGGAETAGSPAKRARVEDWLVAPSWRRAQASLAAEAATTLVIASGTPEDQAILAHLTGRVITAVPSATPDLVRIEADRYAIDPAAPAQLAALLDAASEGGAIPPRIVHLASLAVDPGASFDEAARLGVTSLLHLARALAGRPTAITVVTRGAAEVLGDEPLIPANAAILGLTRVIPQEMKEVRCRVVDVLAGASPARVAAEIRAAGDEPSSTFGAPGPQAARSTFGAPGPQAALRPEPPRPEPLVALRGAHRWLPAFDPIPAHAAQPTLLREGGVYLVVGGTGGVGLAVAEHLAKAHRAKLVLAGRTGLVAREAWDEWLATHPAGDKISRRIQRIRAVEALGSEVMVTSVDAADPRQMGDLVARTTARFGALNGVFHAAGSAGPEALRAIADTDAARSEAHLPTKVRALPALAAALPPGVDFCLLCSSIAITLGGVGLGAYAAAHAFMDAFAAEQDRKGGTRWIAVDWDAFRPDADDASAAQGALAALAMRPDEAGAALGAILRTGLGRVLVSTVDLDARRDALTRLEEAHRADSAEADAKGTVHPRPALDTPFVAPRTDLEAALAEIWQKLFGIDQIGVDDNFFALGGDSLLAIQLAARVRDAFGIEVPIVDLFEIATVAGLAAKLEKLRAEGRGGHEAVESTLAMIEDMSEEEVKRMLAELGQK